MEISNDIMYRTLRNRADREHRELLRAMQRNHRLNKRFEDLQAEGNLYVPYQYYCPRTGELLQGDRLGNVVRCKVLPERALGKTTTSDGKWTPSPGQRLDSGDVVAGKAGWKNVFGDKPDKREIGAHIVDGPRPRAIQSEAWSNY